MEKKLNEDLMILFDKRKSQQFYRISFVVNDKFEIIYHKILSYQMNETDKL